MKLIQLSKAGNREVLVNPDAIAYLEKISDDRTKIVFSEGVTLDISEAISVVGMSLRPDRG